MKHLLRPLVFTLFLLAASCTPQTHTLHIVTTGDVHGSWFDEPYVEGQSNKTSLMSVHAWVDSLRHAVGAKNVLLLDAGDCLQGDNAPYYFNYVDTETPHLFPRLAGRPVRQPGAHLVYRRYDLLSRGLG